MEKGMFGEEATNTASEDFKKNQTAGYRYVDKTALLVPLLRGDHESTFFLRPRRFGKTLTLSMIHYFMEDTRDENLNAENRSLFQGLKIMEMGERYTSQMTNYPVVHLTMQSIGGRNYKDAYKSLQEMLREIFKEKSWILESNVLDSQDRIYYERMSMDRKERGEDLDPVDVKFSLKRLTAFLRMVTGKRPVVLIDEYDVPLEKAYRNGYYRQMVDIIGPMLQNVLKTNSVNLQFAVVTGCLRIAKEGIYTGLNNPEINSVLTRGENDIIGFTDEEVRQFLTDSGYKDHYEECRAWYDGYLFGRSHIYNPWSVIKYIEDLRRDVHSPPALHWAGTSENAILRELAERADEETREKAEQLVLGEEITFALRNDIVYDDLFQSADNVFNVMLATGYITATQYDATTVRARIPNREVRQIFKQKFGEWFRESAKTFDVKGLYACMERGDAERVEEILNDQFFSAMSYFDTLEAFYHGVIMTLMQLNKDYDVKSNRESGSGRFDVSCKQRRRWKLAFVLEFKVSDEPKFMIRDARAAANQIEDKQYVQDFLSEGYEKVMTYGFAFCEKRCRVCRGKDFGNE